MRNIERVSETLRRKQETNPPKRKKKRKKKEKISAKNGHKTTFSQSGSSVKTGSTGFLFLVSHDVRLMSGDCLTSCLTPHLMTCFVSCD